MGSASTVIYGTTINFEVVIPENGYVLRSTAVVPTPVTVNPYPRCGILRVSFTTTSEVLGLIATGIEVLLWKDQLMQEWLLVRYHQLHLHQKS